VSKSEQLPGLCVRQTLEKVLKEVKENKNNNNKTVFLMETNVFVPINVFVRSTEA